MNTLLVLREPSATACTLCFLIHKLFFNTLLDCDGTRGPSLALKYDLVRVFGKGFGLEPCGPAQARRVRLFVNETALRHL